MESENDVKPLPLGYLRGFGLLSLNRDDAPTSIRGITRDERKRIQSLEARRNWLAVKLQDGAPLHYERAEMMALEWALEIIQDYFVLVNSREDG